MKLTAKIFFFSEPISSQIIQFTFILSKNEIVKATDIKMPRVNQKFWLNWIKIFSSYSRKSFMLEIQNIREHEIYLKLIKIEISTLVNWFSHDLQAIVKSFNFPFTKFPLFWVSISLFHCNKLTAKHFLCRLFKFISLLLTIPVSFQKKGSIPFIPHKPIAVK